LMAPLSHDGSRPHDPPYPSIPPPTPHPHHVHDECACRRRSYGGSCISRAYSRTSGQLGFHGISLEAGQREWMGTPRHEQARGMRLPTTPGLPSRRGSFLAPAAAPARIERVL
jgi:hypothetical protein